MKEREINGTRVVFRDKIPAAFGWKLLGPMNRLSVALQKRREELLEQITEPLPDGLVLIPGDEIVEIVQDVLAWSDVVGLVRGAVESWEFDGDLNTDACCDNLDALTELFSIVVEARAVYFGVNLRGEAAGGSTNT